MKGAKRSCLERSEEILSRKKQRELVSKGAKRSKTSPTVSTIDGLEERKKIDDAMQSYEEMYDTDYFNQSTISHESKDGCSEDNKKVSDEEVEVETVSTRLA